jgi:hypothetical protein
VDGHLALAQGAEQAGEQPADDPDPVGAEEPQQGQRGGAVQRDDMGAALPKGLLTWGFA